MSKTYISTFSYKGKDLDVLYNNSQLSFIFEMNGERFGNAVKCEGKSIRDIMNATMCLLVNYLETREAAEKKHASK